jgi:hypothetical protein
VRITALLRPVPSLHDVERALFAELEPYAGGARRVPNAWTVALSSRDQHRVAGSLPSWSDLLAARVVDRHDRLGLPASGLVTVTFTAAADVEPGRFRVGGAVSTAPAPGVRRPDLVPGRPRLVLAAGGTARFGTPAAAGLDREVCLPPGTFVIGRDRTADLRLADPAVSPRHLALDVDVDHIRLRDLGSRNGTRVDGRPVEGRELVDGNRIELGTTTLVFHRDANQRRR